MNLSICFMPGDGIGPEIMVQARMVLDAVADKFGHSISLKEALIGGIAIDKTDSPLPKETIEKCLKADAVLLGAVGGEKWDKVERHKRPETGLLGIRKALGLYANLRPAILFPELASACFLRPDLVKDGLDILVVRELTGGIYFGEPRGEDTVDGNRRAFNTMVYTEPEVERIAHQAFKAARKRSGRVCSVDKANVLEVSQLWRDVVVKVSQDYPDVELSHLYVDNAAMQLIRDPAQFDVIVTSNLFGDILSDEASVITGSIGMLPSASLGDRAPALYEPIHGSAPDIAGQDKANPMATILSLAMMFRYSFNLEAEADLLEKCVQAVLKDNFRTGDIMQEGCTLVGCKKMGKLVTDKIISA